MNIREAKIKIAAYLSSRARITRDELQQACEVIQADEEYVRYLKDEFGLSGNWSNVCQVFRSQVAEFTQLSRQEREREMPELVEHVEDCKPCRQAYWGVKETWESVSLRELESSVRAIRKRLSESIQLVISTAGRLTERGLGPPALVPQISGAIMGDDPEEGGLQEPGVAQSKRKAWELEDEEARCKVKFIINGLMTERVTLKCWLETEPASSLDTASARIEIYNATTNALHLSGRLSGFQSEPIVLAQGKWLVRIIAYSDTGVHSWDLLFEITDAGISSDTEAVASDTPEDGT